MPPLFISSTLYFCCFLGLSNCCNKITISQDLPVIVFISAWVCTFVRYRLPLTLSIGVILQSPPGICPVNYVTL